MRTEYYTDIKLYNENIKMSRRPKREQQIRK